MIRAKEDDVMAMVSASVIRAIELECRFPNDADLGREFRLLHERAFTVPNDMELGNKVRKALRMYYHD